MMGVDFDLEAVRALRRYRLELRFGDGFAGRFAAVVWGKRPAPKTQAAGLNPS